MYGEWCVPGKGSAAVLGRGDRRLVTNPQNTTVDPHQKRMYQAE